jgi:hypothetical protein
MRKAFTGINTITFTFNFGNTNRCWTHIESTAGTATLTPTTGVTFSFVNPPSIIMMISDGNPLAVPAIPRNISYAAERRILQTSAIVTMTPRSTLNSAYTQSSQFLLNTWITPVMPRAIVLYLRRSAASRGDSTPWLKPDTYGYLSNLSIDVNQRANLLSSYDSQQLYLMSVKNGLKCSWPDWYGGVGSVCIVTPSDLGMELNSSANVLGQTSFTIRAYGENHSALSVDYTLNALYITDSLVSVDGSSKMWSEITGYLTPESVVSAAVSLSRQSEATPNPPPQYGPGVKRKFLGAGVGGADAGRLHSYMSDR